MSTPQPDLSTCKNVTPLPAGNWKICAACEGIGGHFDGNMQWIDCPECEGAEGWME